MSEPETPTPTVEGLNRQIVLLTILCQMQQDNMVRALGVLERIADELEALDRRASALEHNSTIPRAETP